MGIALGAIADDFTGATDLASTWAKTGMRVVQMNGVPREDHNVSNTDAIVIALKTRTVKTSDAIAQSLEALSWLRESGAKQTVFKYCSTFDSTEEGNIGPVADALLEAMEEEFALICPAFPSNGRTVYQGYLFVEDRLLNESPMKFHPLTPMNDSNLIRLMEKQSRFKAGHIPLETVRKGSDSVLKSIARLQELGCRYGVADAISNEDLLVLGKAVQNHALVTGGSGIGMGLPQNFMPENKESRTIETKMPKTNGRSIVIAGSCSEMTRKQIANAPANWISRKLNADEIATDENFAERLADWVISQSTRHPILVYTSSDPKEVEEAQNRHGQGKLGETVEQTMGNVAKLLVENGFDKIIVAGGETSGAVVSALKIRALEIGPEIAPGVPWCLTIGTSPPLSIALKSGNFGKPDFFETAMGILP